MQLKNTGHTILSQIYHLVTQLKKEEYAGGLDLLNGNSIGKHVRHVLEFFELLTQGARDGLINYDQRSHTPLYESDIIATATRLEELKEELSELLMNQEIQLEVSYTDSDADAVKIKSSIERELAYNIEHAIHHMAIIKIAIQTVFPNVTLPDNFGVAYSTVRFQKSTK